MANDTTDTDGPVFSKEAADAVRAFVNCGDLVASKQMVEEQAALLLSDDAETCFALYLERFGDDASTRSTLVFRRDLLRLCREVGIDIAFARALLSLYPDPVPDDVIAALSAISDPNDLIPLLEAHPEWTEPVQRLVVGGQFREALLARLQEPAFAPGQPERVVLCRTVLQLVDRRVDPELWVGLAGELANALMSGAAGDPAALLDEAEALYARVLDHYVQAGHTALVATSLNNLGQALAIFAPKEDVQRRRRGIEHLEHAAELRPKERVPHDWAQTQVALAEAHLAQEDGAGAAVDHARAALSVLDPDGVGTGSPHATLRRQAEATLAEALGAVQGEGRRAALEEACARLAGALRAAGDLDAELYDAFGAAARAWAQETGNGRTVLDGASREGRPNEGGPVEGLVCALGDAWTLASVAEVPGSIEVTWTPRGESPSNWTELVTVEAFYGSGGLPRQAHLAARRMLLQAHVTNGTFDWEVLDDDDQEHTYTWSIRDDFAVETQVEVVRAVPGVTALHLVHWARRGIADAAALEEARALLRTARLDRLDPRALAAAAPDRGASDDVQARIERLSREPEPGEPADAAAFLEEMLEGVRRSMNPALWASLNALCGMHLLRGPDDLPPEQVETARAALQRALEVWSPSTHPDEWLAGVRSLVRAYDLRTTGDPAHNRAHAVYGCRRVIVVCSGLGRPEEEADAFHELGILLLRGTERDVDLLTESVEAFASALRLLDPDRRPEAWSMAMLSMGDAFLKRAAARTHPTDADADQRRAVRCYEQVVERFAASERFAGIETDAAMSLLAVAIERLQTLDRAGLPEPADLDAWKARPRRGHALYLRPLVTSGDIVLANRFRETGSLALRFPEEPPVLTLEAALYRVLGPVLTFSAVAGRPEGLGGTRWFSVGGSSWKDIVLVHLESAAVVLMVPHGSPGVRWEIETLVARRLLGRVVLVMPPLPPRSPAASGFDVAGLWAGAVALLAEFGCALPAYDPAGALLRLDAGGGIADSIPFEAVWDNTLVERLEPMLPARVRES